MFVLHNEKEMSSKYLIHKNTAISRSSKMNILVNELLRIMKNTSLRVKQDERDKHVQHFMHKMQLSEYNQEDRVHVYKKAMRIFRENVEGKEVYPHVDKFARLSKMTRQKVQQKKTWFKNGRYKSVFYVDATKDGFLAKECQKILNRCDVPIKVMEKTGESLKRMLTKSNPFRTGNCDDPECPVCLRECGINCRTSDVVYQNYCVHHETCNGKYNGETADIIKERFGEHLDDARLRPESSTMWKHAEEKHNGESVEFKVKILGSCPGDALLRQCMEAVSIRDENPEMNRRAEWGAGNGKQKRKKANNNNNNQNQKKKKTNNSNNDENRKSNSSNNNNLDDNEDTDSTDQNDNSNNASNSASATGSTNRRRQLHANRKSNRNLDDNEDANSTNQNDNSSNASNSASTAGINTRRRQLRANRKSNSNLDDNEDANSTNQNDNSNNASNSAIGTGINTRRRQLRANRKSNSNLDENEDADSTNQNCNSDNASNSVSQTGITNRRRQLRTNRKNSNNSNLDDNEDADSTNQNDNSNSASNSASTTGITNQRRQLRQHNKKKKRDTV